MFLIVGLGNPEPKYSWTRHNVGFELINKLAYDNNIDIRKVKHRSHFGQGTIAGHKVILAKPTTYMNLSGESIREIVKTKGISLDNVIIIHDEIQLETGQTRLKFSGGHGGHNGIRNTITCLGTNDFTRIRIGIGHPGPIPLSDYVLSKFHTKEHPDLISSITKAGEATEYILNHGVDMAMNIYNQK